MCAPRCLYRRANTKLTFQREGDEAPGRPAGDVVLRLREKPHPFFSRKANDLEHTAQISLSQVKMNLLIFPPLPPPPSS